MVQVDKKFSKRNDYEIVEHEGKVYEAILNQTDMKKNENKFYIIQLLQNKKGKKKNYILFTRWGRIGRDGQQAEAAASTLQQGIQLYTNKYDEKIKKYAEVFDEEEEENNEEEEELEQVEIEKPIKKQKVKKQEKMSTRNDKKVKVIQIEVDDNDYNPEYKVDRFCPNKEKYELIVEDKKGVQSAYMEEESKFYYLQGLQTKNAKNRQYFLYTRYGKIDCKGSVNLSSGFQSKDVVLNLYEEKYQDKSMKGCYSIVANTLEEHEENCNSEAENEQDEQEDDENEDQDQQQQQNQNQQVDEYLEGGYTLLIDQGKTYSAYMEQSTKFYKIQVVSKGSDYYFYNRYGKIDQKGTTSLSKKMSKDKAIKEYGKKYKDKAEKGGYSVIQQNNDLEEEDEEQENNLSNDNNNIIPGTYEGKDSYLGYKNQQKELYIALSKLGISQNKLIRQKIFQEFLPKKIIAGSIYDPEDKAARQLLKSPDPLQFLTVQEIQIKICDQNIYQQFLHQFSKLLPYDLKSLSIDFETLHDDNDEEYEKKHFIKFLQNFKYLKSLCITAVQVCFPGTAVRRLANVIKELKDLETLECYFYEHGSDIDSLKYFGRQVATLNKLQCFKFDMWDEDQMPYKTFIRLFSHLKTFQMEYEQDDVDEDEDSGADEDNE